VLLLRKDGIIGLQIVLLEQFLTVSDLHVEEGVTYAEELVRLRGHGGMRLTDDVNFSENKKPKDRYLVDARVIIQINFHANVSCCTERKFSLTITNLVLDIQDLIVAYL
jgi:hypothetical protein